MGTLPTDLVIRIVHDCVLETARLGTIAAARLSQHDHSKDMDVQQLTQLRAFLAQGMARLNQAVHDAATRSRTESVVLASRSPSLPQRRTRSMNRQLVPDAVAPDHIEHADSQETQYDPIEND